METMPRKEESSYPTCSRCRLHSRRCAHLPCSAMAIASIVHAVLLSYMHPSFFLRFEFVHAYSSSIIPHRCGGGSLSTSLSLRRQRTKSILRSSISDLSYFNENSTSVSIETDGLDNLLPSTSSLRMKSGSRLTRNVRRATGLSSSVLLPASGEEDASITVGIPNINAKAVNSVEESSEMSWKDRLVDVSNIASLLCVLDCTLLPLVSIAIPAVSWTVGWITGVTSAASAVGTSAAATNSFMIGLNSVLASIPAIGHSIALYFVIPVGLLTTVVNYFFGHKEVRFSVPALLGVMLIYVANSHGIGIPSVDAFLESWGIIAKHHAHAHGACGAVSHVCSEGLAHRLTNTLGCAFLLGSNYASRKFMEQKSQGCAASALAEAWGGEGGGRIVCGPNCGCEQPSYGTGGSSSTRLGGETFFQWERTSRGRDKGRGNSRRSRFF